MGLYKRPSLSAFQLALCPDKLKALEDGVLEKRKSPGRSLGVIGGERERRRNAPDSLIVRRFSFAPT
ncbi:MAG TPA: hypothetical protein VG127_00945, partial [Rubrobacteraceae bacterium]|nr:hypothetical protein [Rubrobacteraceae bacterium]